jgi:hypothetical protein
MHPGKPPSLGTKKLLVTLARFVIVVLESSFEEFKALIKRDDIMLVLMIAVLFKLV